MKTILITLFTAFWFIPSTMAQLSKRVSLPDTVRSKYIEIAYSRPSQNKRQIFGGLVPFGKVWRTGANEATVITFKKACQFNGEEISEGSYTLFTIPEKESWTVILNSQLKQWGAFAYEIHKAKNVLTTSVPTRKTDGEIEKFTFSLPDANIQIAWDDTYVSIPIKF
jgi:hypothetical protein